MMGQQNASATVSDFGVASKMRFLRVQGAAVLYAACGKDGNEYIARFMRGGKLKKHIGGALKHFREHGDIAYARLKAKETLGSLSKAAATAEVPSVIVSHRKIPFSNEEKNWLTQVWDGLETCVKLSFTK